LPHRKHRRQGVTNKKAKKNGELPLTSKGNCDRRVSAKGHVGRRGEKNNAARLRGGGEKRVDLRRQRERSRIFRRKMQGSYCAGDKAICRKGRKHSARNRGAFLPTRGKKFERCCERNGYREEKSFGGVPLARRGGEKREK